MAQIQVQMKINVPTNQDVLDGLEALKATNKGGEFLAKWTIEVDPDFIRKTLVPLVAHWPRVDLAVQDSSHTAGHLLLEAMYYVVNLEKLDPTLDKAVSLFKRSVHVEKKIPVVDRSLWHHRAAFNHYKLFLNRLNQKRNTISTAEIMSLTKKIPYLYSIASILPENAIKLLSYFAGLERILRAASIEKSSHVLLTLAERVAELNLLTEAQKEEYSKILYDPQRERTEHWVGARTDASLDKKQMMLTLLTGNLVTELRAFLKSLNLPDPLKKVLDQNEAYFAALDGVYGQLVACYQQTKLRKPELNFFHWMIGNLYGIPGLPIFDKEKSLEAFRAGAQLGDLRCRAHYTRGFADKVREGFEISASLRQEADEWVYDVMHCSLEIYTNIYAHLEESENKEQKLRIEWLDFVCDAAILHHSLLFARPLLTEDDQISRVNMAVKKLDSLSDQYEHLKSITFLMKHNLALAAGGLAPPENVALQFLTYASAARLVVQNPNADLVLKREYLSDIKMFRENYAAFIPDEANYHFSWTLDPHFYENFVYQLKQDEAILTDDNIEDYNSAIYLFLRDPFLDNHIPGVINMKKQLVMAAAVKPGFKITENIDDLEQNKMISQFLYESFRGLIAKISETLNVEEIKNMCDILSHITPAAANVYMAMLSLKQQVLSRQLQLIAPLLEQTPNDSALKAQGDLLSHLAAENNQRLQSYERITKRG